MWRSCFGYNGTSSNHNHYLFLLYIELLQLSIINFRFNIFDGPQQHLPAMRRIRGLADKSNFTTGDRISIAWSKIFSSWITDEVNNNLYSLIDLAN